MEVFVEMAVRSNLRLLHLKRETQKGRRITYREVHNATGVAESIISRWMKDKVKNFNADTIERFCKYYNCTPGDLIVLDDDDQNEVKGAA